MKYVILFVLGTILTLRAQIPVEKYPVDSASVERVGVPKGEVLKFSFDQSKIFPGTWREYWVYVPAQYDPKKPACVYVNQDGIQWKAPTVFDNLIHTKEMPVTIGVFVMHGKVNALNPDEALDRFNRSFEYDGLGDAYARFILEEILPEVEKKKTSDGRLILLSKNGNDRAIGGSSSGAVCAFTAAWERPDAFSRVFSAIGTYVGLRGADRYPTLVRKYEPKPLRVFLQDGENDLNIYAGDWWMANQMMLRALTFAGYAPKYQWGQGGHNGKQGTALFPEAMRYLWKDWPEPIRGGVSQNQMMNEILLPESTWEVVADNTEKATSLRVYPEGMIYLMNAVGTSTSRVEANGKWTTNSRLPPLTKKVILKKDTGIRIGGSTFSPDQTQLYYTEPQSHWVWAAQVQPDGTLLHRQRFGWLHLPDIADDARAHGLVCDREGRVYVATSLGVQILDQTGRVNVILPLPQGEALGVALGGPLFNYLYVLTERTLYRRMLNVHGANGFDKAVKPVKPRL